MNERLKELYLQAHSIRYHDSDPMREGNPPTVYWQGEVSAQRFAELIVKECCAVIETDLETNRIKAETDNEGKIWVNAQLTFSEIIKLHFGVEE